MPKQAARSQNDDPKTNDVEVAAERITEDHSLDGLIQWLRDNDAIVGNVAPRRIEGILFENSTNSWTRQGPVHYFSS